MYAIFVIGTAPPPKVNGTILVATPTPTESYLVNNLK
jgi:hypothetical protein